MSGFLAPPALSHVSISDKARAHVAANLKGMVSGLGQTSEKKIDEDDGNGSDGDGDSDDDSVDSTQHDPTAELSQRQI